MSAIPLAFLSTGLVTSVGLSAPASCAAIRAKLSNPTETRFKGADGDWILAHQVELDTPRRGLAKLAAMAVLAIDEALEGVPRSQWPDIVLLLCVAESDRPGRLDGLDDQLFLRVESELGVHFAPQSAIVAHGRVAAAVALERARTLIAAGAIERVLIAAVDSLVLGATLSFYGRQDRLLAMGNSNGFMPGEGASALIVCRGDGWEGMTCVGIGFGREHATVDRDEPLRAEGLTQALRAALIDAHWGTDEQCFRVAALSGEQYYFKESSLAASRALRQRKEDFGLWHPTECMGEAGAASALACLVVGFAAAAKQYAPAARAIHHFGNDEGARAVVLTEAR